MAFLASSNKINVDHSYVMESQRRAHVKSKILGADLTYYWWKWFYIKIFFIWIWIYVIWLWGWCTIRIFTSKIRFSTWLLLIVVAKIMHFSHVPKETFHSSHILIKTWNQFRIKIIQWTLFFGKYCQNDNYILNKYLSSFLEPFRFERKYELIWISV